MARLSYHNKLIEKLTEEELLESVIDQAKEAYATDKITLEVFEDQVHHLLRGKTPVDSEGWPIYYDHRLLRYVNY